MSKKNPKEGLTHVTRVTILNKKRATYWARSLTRTDHRSNCTKRSFRPWGPQHTCSYQECIGASPELGMNMSGRNSFLFFCGGQMVARTGPWYELS